MGESNRLSAKFVEQIKTPGIYRDGNGLILRVKPKGKAPGVTKYWLLRVTVKGRSRDFGIGSTSEVSLREARDMAHDMRKVVRSGGDPVAKRQTDRHGVVTFAMAAEKVHAQRLKSWGNAKHRDQWINTLRTYAFPIIGKVPAADVQSADALKVLLPIWLQKPETARRVRQRLGAVLTWAVANGHRSPSLVNAAVACGPGLPRQPRRDNHHAAVPWEDIPAFTAAVRNSESREAVRLALEFLLLTATRTSEVLGAKWAEVDRDTATWTIPASRMKGKREHRVPLSQPALDVLDACRARWPAATHVFPGRHGKGLSNMALLMLMRRLKRTEVPHGLRSSFRDWAADMRKASDLAEAALAHVLRNKVEAAYQRSDLFEARRDLMDEWAAFACSQPADDRRGQRGCSRNVSMLTTA
jgi:integrase